MADNSGIFYGSRSVHRLTPEAQAFITYLYPKISRSQLEAEARPLAQRIYENWKLLKSIVERHEATVQGRWLKKSKVKRRAILLRLWPGMPVDHRPDQVAYQKSLRDQPVRGIKYPVAEGSPHHAIFMMPYINQQDLCRAEPLLLMVNARARNPPGGFANKDLEPSKFAFRTASVQLPHALLTHVMNFPVQDIPDGYGELTLHDWQRFPTLPNHGPQQSASIGLSLLRIQDRLYDFLTQVVQEILHDIPVGDLLEYPIADEPSSIAANSRAASTTGIVTLSNRNLEAPYILPGPPDLERLKALASVRATEAEDVLSALREDPEYFSSTLKEYFDHQPHLFKALPNGHLAPLDPSSDPTAQDVLADTADKYIRTRIADVEKWSLLSKYMERISVLKKEHYGPHGNLTLGQTTPEDLAIVFFHAHTFVEDMLREALDRLVDQFMSSPAVRAYVRPGPPVASRSKGFGYRMRANTPVPIERLSFILASFHRNVKADVLGSLGRVALLLDDLDHFYNDSSARKTISSFLAAKISDLSLVAGILHDLEVFFPDSLESMYSHFPVPAIRMLAAWITDQKVKAIVIRLRAPFSSHTAKMVLAFMMDVSYPVQKRRSKTIVEALQKAELGLDNVWKAIIGDAKRRNALSTRCQRILDREPYRTPDWVDPPSPELPVANELPNFDANLLTFYRGNQQVDTFIPQPIRKTKPKTRGKEQSIDATTAGATLTQPATEPTAPTENSKIQTKVIKVDARSLQVFQNIFFVPSTSSQPGEVAWVDFLHAMRNIGFALEKLGGSAWNFTPAAEHLVEDRGLQRSICFHEPHPGSRLPFCMARRNGRRLQRAYGWNAETFTLE